MKQVNYQFLINSYVKYFGGELVKKSDEIKRAMYSKLYI